MCDGGVEQEPFRVRLSFSALNKGFVKKAIAMRLAR